VKHEPSPATFIPNQKGGQNLKDEDNFVYRKYRGRADESAGVWYICVRKDALKCPALVLLDPDRMVIAKVRGCVDPDPHGSALIRVSVADPGCSSRIPDPDFYPSRIQGPKTATKERGGKKSVVTLLPQISQNVKLFLNS
jgi:hypothetical protein